MKKKTVTGMFRDAKTKRSELCSFGLEHRYEYLFLHLIVQEGSYQVLKCRNCGEIIKERVIASAEELVTT